MANSLKITFIIAHRIGDRILRIVKCNRIALCLYSLAMIPNTEKSIDILIRPNKRDSYHLSFHSLLINFRPHCTSNMKNWSQHFKTFFFLTLFLFSGRPFHPSLILVRPNPTRVEHISGAPLDWTYPQILA